MLSANAVAALEIACPQNRGSQVGGAGTDGAEIANAINATTGRVAADVAAVSAPAAVDLPTAEALANANKAAINAILVALKAAGLMS